MIYDVWTLYKCMNLIMYNCIMYKRNEWNTNP